MTENTIDLATIALNLSSSPDAAGPGNTGVCRGESPFDKSLELAMHLTNAAGDIAIDDTGQGLPLLGQELPPEVGLDLGLEDVQEIRALAHAISRNTRTVAEKNTDSLMSGDSFGGTPASLIGAFAPFLSLEEHLSGDPKVQTQLFRDALSTINQERKMVSIDASLPTQNVKSGENRQSSTENPNGIPLVTQANGKPLIHVKEFQAPQQPIASKSPDTVSSTELATHLRVLKSSGGGEARLQLHPAELGRMTVSLTTEGNETRIVFVVDNAQAKHAVEASLPRLRDLMDGAGLNLADADVSQRDSENKKSQSNNQMSEDGTTNSAEGIDVSDESTVATGTHLIDAFA